MLVGKYWAVLTPLSEVGMTLLVHVVLRHARTQEGGTALPDVSMQLTQAAVHEVKSFLPLFSESEVRRLLVACPRRARRRRRRRKVGVYGVVKSLRGDSHLMVCVCVWVTLFSCAYGGSDATSRPRDSR